MHLEVGGKYGFPEDAFSGHFSAFSSPPKLPSKNANAKFLAKINLSFQYRNFLIITQLRDITNNFFCFFIIP